jgi:hypothetical protein
VNGEKCSLFKSTAFDRSFDKGGWARAVSSDVVVFDCVELTVDSLFIVVLTSSA